MSRKINSKQQRLIYFLFWVTDVEVNSNLPSGLLLTDKHKIQRLLEPSFEIKKIYLFYLNNPKRQSMKLYVSASRICKNNVISVHREFTLTHLLKR